MDYIAYEWSSMKNSKVCLEVRRNRRDASGESDKLKCSNYYGVGKDAM